MKEPAAQLNRGLSEGAGPFARLLGYAGLALLMFDMLHTPYKGVLPKYELLQSIELQWITALFVLALGYGLVCLLFLPERRAWLFRFLRGLCTYEQIFLIWLLFWSTLMLLRCLILFGIDLLYIYRYDLSDAALVAFVMFPIGRVLGSARMKRLFEPMLKVVLLPHAVFYAWVLWQYLHMNFVTFPSGSRLEIIYYSMYLGVHRNNTGAFALTMLTAALYFAVREKGWRKLPYCCGIIVYLAVLVYSNCRTSWYAVLLLAVLTAFLWVWYGAKEKKPLLRAAWGLLAAAAAVLVLHYARILLFAMLDSALDSAGIFMEPEPLRREQSAFALRPLSARPEARALAGDPRRSLETGGLSGRGALFKACLHVMFSDKYIFLFGLTPEGVGYAAYGLYGVERIEMHAHNYFLQLGMSYGVPTMLASMVFMASLGLRCIRVLRHVKRLPSGVWIIPVILLCLLAQDMMQIFLIPGPTFITVMFYVFAGWISAMDWELKSHPPERLQR